MASYDWQKLPGTEQDVEWRDLHVDGHYAEIHQDSSWVIFCGRGRHRVKVARGFEGTRADAKRAIRDWERRKGNGG